MQTAIGNDPFPDRSRAGYLKRLLRKFLLFQVRGFRIPRERGFVRLSGRGRRLEAKRNLRLGRGHA